MVLVPEGDGSEDPPRGPRYALETVVGRGGMAEVYRGREPSLERTVAVKRLHRKRLADPVQHQRFLREAKVTAQLEHPAIIPIYGLEADADGGVVYAMKLVRGRTLAELLEDAKEQIKSHGRAEGALSLKARVETFVPVLNALAYAHGRGVIHRDLKPDNVMVGPFGEVLVMDWGIARILGSPSSDAPSVSRPPVPSASLRNTQTDTVTDPVAEGDDTLAPAGDGAITRQGTVLGTVAYMSPEQAKGQDLDPASDQYALGLMLQEVVTLEPPIPGRSPLALQARALRGDRAPITDRFERIPRELRAIIAKATAVDRDQRYPSVGEMAEDVRRFLRDESVAADPDSGLRKVSRWIGNHRATAMALGAGLMLLGIAIAAVFAWRGEVAVQAEREAAHRRERAITALQTKINERGKTMIERFHGYEKLHAKLVQSMRIYLTDPAPGSNAVVHKYRGGEPDPATIPPNAIEARAYGGQVASLRHPDFAAAPGVDLAAARGQIDQLARLEPVLRETLLASAGQEALRLPMGRAEHLVLQRGVPLVWVYVGTASGLSVGLPGTWEYDDSPDIEGYDPRLELWYVDALRSKEPLWSTGTDENGLGLLMSLAEPVRNEDGELLGVAAMDLAVSYLIEELLDIRELAAVGAEAFLLDTAGTVQVRSSQKDLARTMTEYVAPPYEDSRVLEAIRGAESGHLRTPDGRLALWTSLGKVGLIYLVVGAELDLRRGSGL